MARRRIDRMIGKLDLFRIRPGEIGFAAELHLRIQQRAVRDPLRLRSIAGDTPDFRARLHIRKDRQRAWRYFQAVQTLLTPAMPAYDVLHGKYMRRLGYFYENLQKVCDR